MNEGTKRHLGRIVGLGAMGLFILLRYQTANGATITVTTASDDITPNNGSVSLREAITAINAGNNLGDPDIIAHTTGVFGTNDTINFAISGAGVKTINVGTSASASGIPLPTMTKPRIINGYTQGVASPNTLANADSAVLLIQLNGTSAGSGSDGMTLGSGSGGSIIKGLVINRFTGNGIVIRSNGNTIAGNFIGIDPTGTTRMPNGSFPVAGDGISIQNASNNIVGTPAVADRNVISGNAIGGVHVIGTLVAPATGNTISGNFIGVAADGKSSIGSRTEPAPAPGTAEGNNLYGIQISGGNLNTVGGTTAGSRNVVGFNADGIDIDNGGQQNVIQGNFCGVGADGVTQAANLFHGIVIRSSNGFSAPLGPPQANEPGASFNTIGGTAAGAGNLVEFNGSAGIAIFGNPVSASGQANVGDVIEGNSVFKNGRSSIDVLSLGIDLSNGSVYPKDDGVTPNDSKGHNASNAPDNFQNFPVLTVATSTGGTTNVAGTLGSAANSAYRIEFFANDPDPLSVPTEGQQFIGFTNVNTNASGNALFSLSLSVPVANGRIITATATDSVGNTSEFSAGITVPTQPPTPTPTPTATATATPPVPARALNISTRMSVQGGNNVLIAGFIVSGSDQKTVAVRGIGPSLAQFFNGTLVDPTLELHSGNLTLDANDNWQDNPGEAAQLSANGLGLSDPKEAGIFTSVAPGQFTAILAGKNDGTGVGLVELYDLSQSANSQLANISTRGFVMTGNDVMIGGFILGGNANTRVAVRGIGPSLAQFGLSPILADPTLELHDSNGLVLARNDDWQDAPAEAAQLSANGLSLSDPKEAGIFISLPPGQFTAILAGRNGGVGIGLVEIYNLH